VVNHAVLVLGAPTGLLRNTNIRGLYGDVRLDLAFGLAIADPAHLAEVAPSLARMIGEALMVLAGQGYPEGACTKLTCDAEAASRSSALTRGLGAALEAVYIESASRAGAGAPDAYAAAQQRAEWLAANAYGQRLSEGAFGGEPVAAREAATCPGVAGALFYRLMARSTSGYPQRYMLWFANIAAGDEALGKIVLAATRLGRRATVTGFAQAYATAFPRERDLVIGLLAELQLEGTP